MVKQTGFVLTCVGALLLLAACGRQETVTELAPDSGCDAGERLCSATKDDLHLALQLGPPVRPLVPFDVALSVDGVVPDEESLVIDFRMEGMDMGLNRYRLLHRGNNHYVATVTLPVCTTSRMDWYALVEFTAAGRPYQARFPFQSQAN